MIPVKGAVRIGWAVMPARPLPLLACLALLAAVALLHCGNEAPAVPGPSDLRLPSLDGHEIGTADYRGKVVVVDFWATWCLPCHEQARVLKILHGELSPDEVQFLAVDVGEPEETVRAFVEKRPFPYPVLLDPANTVADKLQILALPTLMILDREGRVAFIRPGITPENELRQAILDAAARG